MSFISHGNRFRNQCSKIMIFLFRARAAAFNQVNIVKILLDSGADKEAKDMMDMTPFLGAVVHGAKDTAELLLNQGANAMAVDSGHNSCLHLGVKRKQLEIVKMLLVTEGKENLMKLRNNELQTFVHIAASLEQKEVSWIFFCNSSL